METTSSTRSWAEVAVPVPLRQLLTYEVRESLARVPEPGMRVLVRVARRKMTGVVVSLGPPREGGPKRLLPILEVLDEEPVFPAELLSFVLRAAEYYMYPPGEALRAALPPGMSSAEKGGKMRRPRGEPAEELCARRLDPQPADPQEALRRAKVRLSLLDLIPPGREVPLAELRRHHHRARHHVNALVEDGFIELVKRRKKLDPLQSATPEPLPPPELTTDQERAVESIQEAVDAGGYRGMLLHGVTGSGKTEVYLRAIASVLARDRTALVLVPEIALTPQLVARFRGRLGDQVAVLHSGLTSAQRLHEWSRIRSGEARVAIGARSAVFAPVRELGIVVVDEEHDPSFKQDEGFRYNGRDLALFRARRAEAIAVLGSATPSLESYFNTQQGKLQRLELPDRVTPRPLPKVEIVDLKLHRSGPSGQTVVTGPLTRALEEMLDAGSQSILFLNRRGYAPAALCGSCGEPIRCQSCSVALTFHRGSSRLECHYCAHVEPMPAGCPSCGADSLHLLGAGTEKAEEMLRALLGERAHVARLDSDVAPGKKSEKVLDRVRSGEVNVLVGTQLVTKGHDLPGVTLVGVLFADASLSFPDFRATERTFQLLTQVAGRAGRGDLEGRVIVQTFAAEHPVIRLAAKHDYRAFYELEMAARRELGYPPTAHMAAVRLNGPDEVKVQAEATRFAELAQELPEVRGGEVRVAGPAPAPIARLRNRFRYRIVLKSQARPPLRRVLWELTKPIDKVRAPLRANFDIDPVHLL